MADTKTSATLRSIRFRDEDEKFVLRYQAKKGFSTFTEALRQMIRKAAEAEGWVR